MSERKSLIEPSYIGDGLYLIDEDWYVGIAVNHHNNEVAALDIEHIDRAIEYLQKVKERSKK